MKRFRFGLLIALLAVLCTGIARGSEDMPPPPVEMLGLSFSHATVIWSFITAVGVWLFCYLASRSFSLEKPGKIQSLLELIMTAFLGILKQSIGKNRGPMFLSFIFSLFLFIWAGNMLGLVPLPQITIPGTGEKFMDCDGDGLYSAGEPFIDANGNGVYDTPFIIPKPSELPTNLNMPLALAILFITIIGQGFAIRYHGLLGYLKSYTSPGGVIGIAMTPMNVVGKIAEHVSISFRIFGNLYGGAMILTILSGLIHYCIIPIPMLAYFGVLAGTIQAFVFTMLALTYVSLEISEND